MAKTTLSNVDWGCHPLGLVSDSFIAKSLGCSDVLVGYARRQARIEKGPRHAIIGIGKNPWCWRLWITSWGEERVLAYLGKYHPKLVPVFEKHRPDIWEGISLDERLERARLHHERAEAVRKGLREKRKASDKPRTGQAPRTGEALRRWKLGLKLTPEERKANSLANLAKANAANAEMRAKLKAAEPVVHAAIRRNVAAVAKLASVEPPKPLVGRPQVRKPEKRQKPRLVASVKSAVGKEKVVDPEVLTRHAAEEVARATSSIEEFMRRHGVKVLAPAGSGKNVGQVIAVRRA